MQLPVQTFPILEPGQMNPFHQALQQGLQNYQQGIQTAYLPKQLQADIASKNAYAENMGKQIAATALSNPLTVANLMDPNNPQGKQQLAALMAQITGNAAPQAQQHTGLWNQFKSLVNGEKPTSTMPTAVANAMNQPAMPSTAGSNGPDMTGGEGQATNQEVSNMAGNAVNNLPAGGAPAPVAMGARPGSSEDYRQGYLAQHFPLSQTGLAATKTKEQQAADVQAEASLWKERTKNNGDQIRDLDSSTKAIDSMKTLYPKLGTLEKGFLGGRGPALTSDAQAFDQFAKTVSTANVRAMQSGHITNTDFQIGEQLKPGRYMNEDSFNSLSDYNKALLMRAKQRQKFDADVKGKIPFAQADQIWADFIEKHPLFNSQTLRIDKKNAEISPFTAAKQQNKQAQFNQDKMTQNGPFNQDQVEGQMPPPGTAWYRSKKSGQIWAIHSSHKNDPDVKKYLEEVG